MTTATETQMRLRSWEAALDSAREREAAARKALAEAVETTRRAREKCEELFLAEEREEVARRKSDYRHETK